MNERQKRINDRQEEREMALERGYGKMITMNGKTMSIDGWAKELSITRAGLAWGAKKYGSIENAIQSYLSGRLGKEKSYVYTGEEFTTITGNRVFPGMMMTTKDWVAYTGIKRTTFNSRKRIFIGSEQDAFNYCISEPVRTLSYGRTEVVHKKECTRKKIKRSSMSILRCRMEHPERRCVPCQFREICY